MHLADLTGQGEGVRVELAAHSFVRNTHLRVLFSVDVYVLHVPGMCSVDSLNSPCQDTVQSGVGGGDNNLYQGLK